MKKITLLFLLFTAFSYSQTTEQEYNYLTKGYKETVSKGLDLKQGYELQDFYKYSETLYTFDFKLFVNQKTKKNSAILVIANSKMWNNYYYLCIPIGNPDLYQRYQKDLTPWDSMILQSYSTALSQILSISLQP
ncbi:hypothetical protein [Flavobacterium lacustre]|uniref:hypothetical protein n=1 Tax=Flavobacterium lacustre TaxID=3016339 RepID=UPI0022B66A5B|nr:hypothetical protein [Flavobacterium lacustre]